MRSDTHTVIDAQSLATSKTSSVINLNQIYGYCVQATVTGGTPAGSYQIQGSCDAGQLPDGSDVTNWFNVGSSVTISAAGTVGTNVDGAHYRWLRVVFTQNSGVGTLTVKVSFKGV